MPEMTPEQFVETWRRTALNERASAQSHFVDVCRLVGHPLPHELDPKGEKFTFEYGVQKIGGGQGFADVFYKGHFAIEYKGKGKYRDLNDAYQQLLRYRENLFNPPLLVVCDIENWEIHTNFPATEKRVYRFTNDDLLHTRARRLLHELFYNPNALHPERNTEQVTTAAARAFERIADNMRDWQADPDRIAHFLTKLVFCLFAEDVGLLPAAPNSPRGVFSEIIEQTRTSPAQFKRYTGELFKAMADGGEVLFQRIPYFNGLLFEDVVVEELQLEALIELANAARLNWSAVEPAIFGTLFERSLDPSKRAQLGAHYTSRDDILLIVEPVLMQPLRREWDAIRAQAVKVREAYDTAESPRVKINRQHDLLALREQMLKRLREITVLDPACGSGNFLYVALNLLLDLEKAVINDPLFAGLTQPFPEVHPRQLHGMELDPIAHALASIVVWIGFIQWRQNNGYLTFKEPILEALHDNIRKMDAIMTLPTPQSRENIPTPDPSPQSRENIPTPDPSPQSREGNLPAHELPSPSHGEGLGVGTTPGVGTPRPGTQDAPAAHIPTYTTRELYEKLKPLARQMRSNPTPAEDALWQRIRKEQLGGFKFRRQHHIDRFIVDFYCHTARLVIEVDGDIHEYTQAEDQIRQEFLESLGLRVLRFQNHEVLQQMRGVLERIAGVLEETLPSPQSRETIPTPDPSPQSREGNLPAHELPSPSHGEGLGVGTTPGVGTPGVGTHGTPTTPTEPAWTPVDVIVGNPPFLGGNRIRAELGDTYVENLFRLYAGRVPASADLVTYWFEKARAQIEQGKAKRAGLLSTNSIRGGANREVLKRIKTSGDIFMAWSDRDWILDGAAVRVSMVGFDDGGEKVRVLDGQHTGVINPDLTGSVDITVAGQLVENLKICFIGTKKAGAFDLDESKAQVMLLSSNASKLSNIEVLSPWINGEQIVKRLPPRWLINFGERSEADAALYELPFAHVREHVYPERQKNNEERARVKWWWHRRPAMEMITYVRKLSRFIATPRVSKYRLFVWYPSSYTADDGVYVFAREDDYFFGVLHSTLHEVWSLRMGTWLGKGNDPRYTPTTTFETFPFPWSPGKEDLSHPAYQAVSAAAQQLHAERHAWLNPPGLSEKALSERTLTNLYNALNVFRGKESMRIKPAAGDFAPRLDALHTALDHAVCAAYGWDPAILPDEEAILGRLLTLNLARAAASGAAPVPPPATDPDQDEA